MPDLELTEVAAGTRLRLRVKPGARGDAVIGVHGGALKVRVAAPPEKGKANKAVLAVLARVFDVPPSALTLTAGAASQDKTVVVPLSPGEVQERLGDL